MRPTRLLPLLLLLPLLGGCRYNYVPLIPPVAEVNLPPRIFGAEIRREGEELVLTAQVRGRFQADYLNVTWFNGAAQLAQDSVYLDAGQREATFRLEAPEKGAYRAALGLGDDVMRLAEFYEVQP
ncbi:hypothetical protein GCM10017783_24250 [Deinococcus piscis]|uniref:Ig-like domain-containing protein n=1 Tax=Deinococcus piscis TaxID=394230 RepID=A0ABQ3KDC1_9DEIO|nr:hypothetical protein [Deinococcus piscis]GHG10987.1 hypothetical protein GCM10017783_24250 [Deinococcus piscis]